MVFRINKKQRAYKARIIRLFPNACLYCGDSLELDKFMANSGNKTMVGKRKLKPNGKKHIEPYRQFCSPLQDNAKYKEGRECVRLNQSFEKMLNGKYNSDCYDTNVNLLIQNFLWQMIMRMPRNIMHLHLYAVLNGLAEPNLTIIRVS